MTRETAIQTLAIYAPLVVGVALGGWLRPRHRERVGLIFACAWVAGMLPLLDGLAQEAGLWSYVPMPYRLGGMPLALYLGWVVLWGSAAPLLAKKVGIGLTLVTMASLDVGLMPQLTPVVILQAHWWLGEVGLLAAVLLPALLLSRWTAEEVQLTARAALLACCFGSLTVLLPALVAAGSLRGLAVAWKRMCLPGAETAGLLAFLLIAAGWSAIRDLAIDGQGTPVPLDPTRRLVTTGIYSYVANPMQVAVTGLLLLTAAILHSGPLAFVAAMVIIYSAGFAHWSEKVDLLQRFGGDWRSYRRQIRPWLPRLRPAPGHECLLFIDLCCGKCAEMGGWFGARKPVQLRICNAAGRGFRRITWQDPQSGRTESGVQAFARALQHLHLGWAALGWVLAFPCIAPVVQACMDASGAAPAMKD